jgi:hypothetical protein
VDADLQSELGSTFWPNTAKGGGIAYDYFRLKYDQAVGGAGIPPITRRIKGRKVYDWRDGTQDPNDPDTWKWSANWALCIADWVMGVPMRNGAGNVIRCYGFRAEANEISDTDAIEAANISDEAVAITTSFSRSGNDVTTGVRHIGQSNVTNISPGLAVSGTGIPSGTVVVSVDVSGTFFTINQDPTATNANATLTFGGTEPRYECHGIIQTTSARGDVIDAMRSAGAGDVMQIGNKWIIRAGAYRTPNPTVLTEDDFRAAVTGLQVKPSRRDLANGVKGTFVSPENNWQATDFPVYTKRIPAANLVAGDRVMIVSVGTTDFTLIGAAANTVGTIFTATGAGSGTGYAEAYIVEDGGDRLWLDIELPFTISSSAAQRIAKIHLERLRQTIMFTGRYKLTAFQHQPTDVVSHDFSILGWSGKTFRVENFEPIQEADAETGAVLVGCDMLLCETAAGVYDWGTWEERAQDVALNSLLPNPLNVVNPTSLSLTSASFRTGEGGILTPQLLVSWTAPADQFVRSGGNIHSEWKKSSDSTWTEGPSVKGDVTFLVILGLQVGETYDVRIQSSNRVARATTWVTQTGFTLAADTTPPNAPSGLAAVTGTGKAVSLSWNKNTDADFSGDYAIYRNTVNNAGTATLIVPRIGATRAVDVNVNIGTQYFYWITAFDFAGNESSKSSGVNATPGTISSGSLDHTPPSDPTAATQTGSGTIGSSSGPDFEAYEQFTVPALPTGAVYQELVFKLHADTYYVRGAGPLTNTGSATGVRVRGLVSGQSYDFATIAYNAFGDPSNVVAVTGGPYTAPGDLTAPGTASGFTIYAGNDTNKPALARLIGGATAKALTVTFTPPSDKDLLRYEVVLTSSDTDAAASLICDVTGSIWPVLGSAVEFSYWQLASTGGNLYLRIRAIDFSGNRGNWARVGEVNTAGYLQLPVGNLVEQNKSAVDFTGGKAIMGGFEANQTAVVDVKGVNIRIIDAGGTQRMRVNNVTGDIYVNNQMVITSRQPAPATLGDVITVLQTHGLTS